MEQPKQIVPKQVLVGVDYLFIASLQHLPVLLQHLLAASVVHNEILPHHLAQLVHILQNSLANQHSHIHLYCLLEQSYHGLHFLLVGLQFRIDLDIGDPYLSQYPSKDPVCLFLL